MPEVAFSGQIKQRIAGNFSRAASTYDQAARLQRRVANRLMTALPKHHLVNTVLDLGSGTGTPSYELAQRYPDAMVTGMDLAMGMLQFARQQSCDQTSLNWCSGDIEALPFKSDCFDLVFSSLAIQWCHLEQVLQEVSRVLKPGGQFVFSTLANGSLRELDAAWMGVAQSNRVNQFDSVERQHRTVMEGALETLTFSHQAETLYYPNLISLLKELKALGVNTVLAGHQGLMTRTRLQGLQQAYERYRVIDGLPLTYQVIYGVLQKTHPGGC